MSTWLRRELTAALGAVVLSGCRVSPGAAQESTLATAQVPVTTVYADQYGGFDEPRRAVIRSAAEWSAFWSGRAVPGLSGVDFDRDMVIAVGLGTRGSGGHSVAVESASRTGGRLVVTVREVSPGTGCMVTQALTSPVVAVRVPKSAEPVEFVVLREQRDCPP